MSLNDSTEHSFIKRITEIVESNLSDEHFGVSQLAKELNVSRYTLHRKIIAATKLSTTQFIRQIRLKKAKQLLRQTSLNVSEVAYKVGFNSPIYFSKCFHDYFDYPPCKVGEREDDENKSELTAKSNNSRILKLILILFAIVVLIVVLFVVFQPNIFKQSNLEKSIAVLPPIYYIDSDSSYVYQLDGTISMVLSNLSLISGIDKVIPWTSVQQYRNSNKSAREIAEELQVSYIVESSGMAMEDSVRLNINLIDGFNSSQIWHQSYEVETEEFIRIPIDIAQSIALEINAKITTEEQERIIKPITKNDSAYNYFLKGKKSFDEGYVDVVYNIINSNKFTDAINYFKTAVEYDKSFALAYAEIANAYYQLDFYRNEKKHSTQINYFADKALLYDPNSEMSCNSKACYYLNQHEFLTAIPWLKEALKYNPNSSFALRSLRNTYGIHLFETEQHLEYALKTISLNIQARDNSNCLFCDYYRLTMALRYAGFFDEVEEYLNLAWEFENGIPQWVEVGRSILLFEKEKDCQLHVNELLDILSTDSLNYSLDYRIGFMFYYMKDYIESKKYFTRYINSCIKNDFEIDGQYYADIAFVNSKIDNNYESELNMEKFKIHIEKNKYNYNQHKWLAAYYSYLDDKNKAIEELRLFSKQHNIRYETILDLEFAPIFDNIRHLPEFQQILYEIDLKFWENHRRIRANLENKGLL